MTPANPDALADALAEFQRRNGFHKREIEELLMDFGALVLAAAEARAAQLQAEVEAKDRALKDERARRKAAVQSVREKAASLCDEAAAYFGRTTGHYDRSQAAGGYRATATKIRLLTPDRTALARAATAREG